MGLSFLQKLTLFLGSTAVLFHTAGVVFSHEYFNFVGALVARVSIILYLSAVDRFRYYSLIPLTFAIANVFFDDRIYLYLEFISQGSIFQIITYITFCKLNKNA